MKKILKLTLVAAAAVVLVAVCAGCGGPKVPERLIGHWQCAELASDGYTDTSFYELVIEEDGTFSLNETSGKPALSGKMEGDDTGKLGILNLTCDESNFNPPVCWAKMPLTPRVRYKIVDENTIRLGYVGIWLTFTK